MLNRDGRFTSRAYFIGSTIIVNYLKITHNKYIRTNNTMQDKLFKDRTCLTLRVDINPIILPTILNNFKNDKKVYNTCLIYAERDPKDHLHIRYTSPLTRQALINRWQKLKTELGLKPDQHAHHTVWESTFVPQVGSEDMRGKWTRLPCKKHSNCQMGSFTYIAKYCELLFNRGYATTFIKKIQYIGMEKLAQSRLPLWDKIIKIGNLTPHSPAKDILQAIKNYYLIVDKPYKQPRAMSVLVHNIKLKLDWKSYNEYYFQSLLWAIKEEHPVFNF